MSILQKGLGEIPAKDIVMDPFEAARRLGVARGYTDEAMEEGIRQVKETARCRYCYMLTPVFLGESGRCDVGFGQFISFDLSKNLQNCTSAYVFAVTLGAGIDRLIARQKVISRAKMFIVDALSSAFAESFCDAVDCLLREGKKCRSRFSPGYGDLPLNVQPQLLRAVEASKIGIALNDSLLMSPWKSITAVMGVLDEDNR